MFDGKADFKHLKFLLDISRFYNKLREKGGRDVSYHFGINGNNFAVFTARA